MTVRTYAANKQVDTTCFANHLLVVSTLSLQILSITVQDMDILLRTIDMVEQVTGHKTMIAFGMAFG